MSANVGTVLKKWAPHSRMPAFFCLCAVLFYSCDLLKPASQRGLNQGKDANREVSAEPASDFKTMSEKLAFYRWLVTEMQEQVYSKPAKGQADVDGWANVLSQRGSVEGVYRGLVLSTEYAALEQGRADLKALRFFAQEMAAFDFPNSQESDPALKAAGEKYAKEYMGKPLFTLKRVLGDRVIQEAETRKGDKDRLAAWYSNFVGRWAKAGVSFGMAQRDRADEAFHFKWAKENNLGMIQWELLNRVHRVLNSYGGIARPAAAPSAPSAAAPNPAGK